jgi:hypothetical protein
MTADGNPDAQPATAAAGNDETVTGPPATEMAQWPAWSVEEPATEAFSRPPWRSVWAIVGIGLFSGVVIALAIFGAVGLVKEDHAATPAPPAVTSTPTVAMTVAAGAQPSTVTVQAPPPTVTVPAPITVTAQAAPPPPDSSDSTIFTICPDRREGVVGGRTTCVFATNVRQMFYATGMSEFIAYSQATNMSYRMTCVGGYTAHFDDGSTKNLTRCTGGDNAEVVIW